MLAERREELIRVYRDTLLGDVLPFWMRHAVDREYGGFLFCLHRDGSLLDTDKPVWIQGRFAWLLSTLYRTVEPCEEWLALARHGLDFLRRYCFDSDGRMFFQVTREGRPLRKRRYLFSECFTTMALSAYAAATGDAAVAREAVDLFHRVIRYHTTPGLCPAKIRPDVRPQKGLAMPMILIVTAQTLREAVDDPICDEWIEKSIEEIGRDFVNEELGCVLETVGPDGEFLDHFDGRQLNPGHAIEAGWFILHEARRRGHARWQELALKIIDWSWRAGWDEQYGGLLYFRDAKGLPSTEYWHDMKFWWPHNEAIIATLLAYSVTGDPKYAEWHELAHRWAFARFPDPEFGEWFGYLHRDGTPASPIKGNMWKGPFHLPRMLWYCWKLLEEKSFEERILI